MLCLQKSIRSENGVLLRLMISGHMPQSHSEVILLSNRYSRKFIMIWELMYPGNFNLVPFPWHWIRYGADSVMQ